MCVSPGVDPVGGSRPPEQLAQVLSDTFPQDLAGALTLLAAANHKLVEVGSATVHWLHGDDGCCTVAGGTERWKIFSLAGFRFTYLTTLTPMGRCFGKKTGCR